MRSESAKAFLISLGEWREWLNVRRKRFWIMALLIVYVLFGFFIAPGILRREIIAQIESRLNRPAALDEVRLNPLAFSADFRGFRLTEKDGSPLGGFDRLYVRFDLISPFRWAWCFADLRLEGAKGTLIRYAVADTNIGRLLPAAEPNAPKTTPDAKPGLARLVIDRLTIERASANFIDEVPATRFETTIGPIDVQLKNFSTLPKAQGEQRIAVETEGGAKLEWTGMIGVNPIQSAGHVTANGAYAPAIFRYFKDSIGISAPAGRSLADLDYQLETRPDGVLSLAVTGFNFSLSDFALRRIDADRPFFVLPALRLTGGHFNWPERRAGADLLSIDGLDLAMIRGKDGQLDLADLLGGASPAPPPQPAAAPIHSPANSWSVALAKFEINHASARLEDRTLREPAAIEIGDFTVDIDNISTEPDAKFPFLIATDMGSGGHLLLKGQVSVLPKVTLDAALSATDLRIAVAEPYLHETARLLIKDGALNFETAIKMDEPGAVAMSGHGELRALKLDDEVAKSGILSLDRIGIDYFEYRTAANQLRISQILVQAPYLHLAVARDRSTNFNQVMVAKHGEPAKSAGPPMRISIGKIIIAKGSADYEDLSLPLPFGAHITDLQGNVGALATGSAAPVRLSMRGKVGAYGETTIEGGLTPFDPGRSTKIRAQFRNIDFPALSPYTVKFAGRRIAKGRLDVDLDYALKNGKLEGANRVVMRDVELGEKVDVPGALDLPLDLALALLTDSDGRINVDLPVSGDLKNPQFDIGRVIRDAIFNLITRIITSPFDALASLFGGDEKLDQIEFEPGRAALSPPEKEKILHLAQTLEKRPKLALIIPGAIDPEADLHVLQLDRLDADMAQKLGGRKTLDRQQEFLETMFRDKIGKEPLAALAQQFTRAPEGQPDKRPVLDEPAYVETLRQTLSKTEAVSGANLDGLGQARAAAVADSLKQTPGLGPERIRQAATAKTKIDAGGTIPLKLEATSATKRD